MVSSQGAEIVIPAFRAILEVIRVKGRPLALVHKGTAALSRSVGLREAAMKNFQPEMEAGTQIDEICIRAHRLITEIALTNPIHGGLAGQRIKAALLDKNPHMRALAGVHSIDRGIPANAVSDTLTNLLYNDGDRLAKFSAAAALVGLSVEPPFVVGEKALEEMYSFLNGVIFVNMPAMVSRVRQSLHSQVEGFQNRTIAHLGVYHALVLRDAA
jgi:hypothetical protein